MLMNDFLPKTDIKEMSHPQIIKWLESNKIAPYRAGQVLKWIYFRQTDRFDEMSDISMQIRQLLSDHFVIARLPIKNVELSKDGSRKYLFELQDQNFIESVLILEKNHYTLCISSQVGCAQGCLFCNTAGGGFIRNLTRGEIISQVRDLIHEVNKDATDKRRLSNVVFMGMGEPLANYKNLVSAIETLTDSQFGLQLSNRRITVSTAGIVPRLYDLGRDTDVNLAVSLNATDDKTRSRLMPINRMYPIAMLLDACRNYPLRPHRRITFEYILLKGINDSEEDARRLTRLLKPIRSKINLIPFNEFFDCSFQRPDESTIVRFQQILLDNHYTVMIRRSKGQDISAACGQLRSRMIK
jgi:23S rRNA (adenine2503-C2)-methyltransferase